MRASLKVAVLLTALAAWGMLWASSAIEAQISSGTVNAKQSGVYNITNISGTVSLPTGAATESTLAKLAIAQGAALGSNTQTLAGGSVTTAAPTYTTGQISPLSLDTAGGLRVNVATLSPATPFTSLVTGQQAVTASAAALPSSPGKRVCIRVLTGGTQVVYFGPSGVSTSTGQELSPGDAWCDTFDNANRVYVIAGGTGSTIAYAVSN